MEVGEVLATMKRHLGAAGDDPPFEGLVAGSATMPVTGVATCAAPSLDVLRRAVADGCNLLLADGHPFYTYDAAWIAKEPQTRSRMPRSRWRRRTICDARASR
jgi:putative NIF3 family GTP cyclohydrolase 1 type 2